MKKAFFFLTLLSLTGVVSVWFLATTPSQSDASDYADLEKQEEEKSKTVELMGGLLKRSLAAIPVDAPHSPPTMANPQNNMQAIPKPEPTADDVVQDPWVTHEQKRQLTINENKQELERDQEILSDPVAWKQKQRDLEKEWQLRELARLEKLREEAPEEYDAQFQLFEDQRAEREIEFDERIQQQIDRVMEKSAQPHRADS